MRSSLYAMLLMSIIAPSMAEHFNVGTASRWPPYAMQTDSGIGGIAVEVLEAIMQRTGDTVSMNIYPAKRLDELLQAGQLDINFADSPDWNTLPVQAYVYSDSYLSITEYLYSLAKQPVLAKRPADLTGKAVGTVEGYYYDAFAPFFKNGSITLITVNSNHSLLKILNLQRCDAAFFDSRLFAHLLACTGANSDDYHRGMQLSVAPVGLKIRRSKVHALPRINRAITALQREGVIDAIVAKYVQHGNSLRCQ